MINLMGMGNGELAIMNNEWRVMYGEMVATIHHSRKKYSPNKITIMNWGHKIIVVYAMFVAGMLFLAYKSSRQNIELVTEGYYAKELVYQQKIDETKRTALLSAPVNIKVINHELTINFPKDFSAKQITGEATLYCPSNEKKDRIKLFTVTDTTVSIMVPENYKGLHYVKINWSAEGVNYYYEQKIII